MSVGTALMVGLTAVPALASTWTVSPGGGFSGTDSVGQLVQVTDTVGAGITVTCTTSRISGTLNSGAGLAGHHIGAITAATFAGCSVGSVTFTVTDVSSSWYLNAVSYASPITSGRVTGIRLHLAGSNGCSAVVGGIAMKPYGITFHYSNSDFALKFAPVANLKFSSVTGCAATATPFANGDPATYTATYYPITPNQVITSP